MHIALCVCVLRSRRTLESRQNMDDDKISTLEEELRKAKAVAIEAERNYEEVWPSDRNLCQRMILRIPEHWQIWAAVGDLFCMFTVNVSDVAHCCQCCVLKTEIIFCRYISLLHKWQAKDIGWSQWTCVISVVDADRAQTPGHRGRTGKIRGACFCRWNVCLSLPVFSIDCYLCEHVPVAQWAKPLLIDRNACWPEGWRLSPTGVQIHIWKGVLRHSWTSGHVIKFSRQV